MKNRRVVDGEVLEEGSGNVFADLGLPNPEERLLKAHLMHAIGSEIRRCGLTQEQAAQRVGLAQPDLSRIMNGHGSGFSLDRLISVLRRLGCDVEIAVSPGGSGPVGALRYREREASS